MLQDREACLQNNKINKGINNLFGGNWEEESTSNKRENNSESTKERDRK